MSWASGARSTSRAVARQIRHTASSHRAATPHAPRGVRNIVTSYAADSRLAACRILPPPPERASWTSAAPPFVATWHSTVCSSIATDKGKARASPRHVGTASPPLLYGNRPTGSLPKAHAASPPRIRLLSSSASSRLAPTIPTPYVAEPPPGPPRDGLTGLGTTHLSPDILLRCTIFDAAGLAKSSSGVFKKSKLCSDHGLEPRDLRKIDSRVPNLVPTILARKDGILVNILHIRAMIKADMVLLFDSYGSSDTQLHSAFVYNLQFNLRQTSSTLPYEFRALESILVSVLDALRIELDLIRSWASRILEGLDDDVDREKLRALLQVSRKLNSFLSRSRGVKGAVTEVLDDDEDMALMYLTDSKQGQARTEQSKMDELELLLESFDKQVEEVLAETEQIHNDMNNTQEVVELILDNNRNKLLALDLRTSIATLGISAGTLWAGLFGMNLTSHFEEDQYAFFVSSAFAILTAAVVSAYGLRQLQRLRRVGLQLREPFGMTRGAAGRPSKYGSDKYGSGAGGGRKRRWWFPFGSSSRSPAPASASVPAYPLASATMSGYYGGPTSGNANNGTRFVSPFMRIDEKYQQALAQHMSDAEGDPRHPFPTTPSSKAASGDEAHERRGPLYAGVSSDGRHDDAGDGSAPGGEGDQQPGGLGGVGLSSKWEARKKRKEQ
ncbi:uncharacterized protein PFL1_03817 [Pseudozyma flocculosa PF-1]|uniref:Magnesium transporter n=2 Tax=Pseudozyma flocculosa TaxID=84751 RepID=A0A5C3EXT6_9BASI|nr:uncharacterized protein PFL1_03817 [Pseudozyma flocculosa PF-1]EPQ28514.1 hypothetical protein PFL1_03817 [Pseudozyma flocculosa PF-1]SPO36436.1 uncharacterized protein PSFLO_01907 [Pseudozyma flocculosa]